MNALGEQHRLTRKRIMPAFTRPKVETYRIAVEDLAERLAARCTGPGSIDVASAYAFGLSAGAVMRVVGASENDHQRVADWTRRVLIFGIADAVTVAEAADEMADYCASLAILRFREPADDVASLIMREWDGVDRNFLRETAATLRLLLLAGIDTTSRVIAGALWHLAKTPTDRQRLINDPKLMSRAVDEFLRFYAPTTIPRQIEEDAELGGTTLSAGQLLMLPFPAANRDPAVFPGPNRLDLGRSPNKHLAFGIGIHRCIGDHLAKMIIEIGLRQWLTSHPNFILDEEQAIEWSEGTVRGIRRMHLITEAAADEMHQGTKRPLESPQRQTSGTRSAPVLTKQAAQIFARAKSAQASKRFDDAIRGFRSVHQQHPRHVDTLLSLGAISLEQGKDAAALHYFKQAAAAAPGDFRPLHNLATIALRTSKLEEARSYAEAAARVAPDDPAAHRALASVLIALGRSAEGLRHIERASDLKPGDIGLLLQKASMKRDVCDWRDFYVDEARLRDAAAKGVPVPPFALLSMEAPNAEQHAAAKRFARALEKPRSEHLPSRKVRGTLPLKIGYLSGDFHDHATSRLVAELFEKHDRRQVTVYGYSYGPNKESAMRDRIVDSFDVFRDVKNDSSKAIAQRIHADGIDILVDMKGYTSRARTEILAWRPAPVQVNYLGFPGTMGASFVDYVITDRVVSPPEYEVHSTEKFAYLPHCFQPNDTRRPMPDGSVTRARYGIPDEAFVYCCFNASYKFTPKMFDIWMRILQATPQSLLALLVRSEEQAVHLRREAQTRGVDPRRLVFAPHVNTAEHLARCALADLFLDTLPVSAFTTASDALWAGLPVLTCAGPTPAGRGSASLLHAMGVPELVTSDLEAYEAVAVQLACDPERLSLLRRRIEKARFGRPPFDTRGLARDLEALYASMAGASAS